MIDVRVIADPSRAFAHPACIRRLPGDIDTNIRGIKTGGQSCHLRVGMVRSSRIKWTKLLVVLDLRVDGVDDGE